MIRELTIPRFKVDEHGEVVPAVHAAAAIIYNPETREVLWEEHSQDQRSIASITKVMTAIVFLESDPNLSQQVFVERGDVLRASVTHLRANERVSVNDLLHMLLMSSDNAAARVLARVSPWGAEGFVARMNEKARELGLTSTSYSDPSGLLADNVSSAYDMACLIAYAAGDERIAGIMRKTDYTITTSRRRLTIHTTNALMRRTDLDVLGGKTGFIASSGYCVATMLRLPELDQPVAVVVLGARSNSARFVEVRNLFSWLSTKARDLFGRKEQDEK
jgi:D-alanyl-D-alanine endopeptidase (penicillin-binding protein 7)